MEHVVVVEDNRRLIINTLERFSMRAVKKYFVLAEDQRPRT